MGKAYRHPAMKQLKDQQTGSRRGTGGWSRWNEPSNFWERSKGTNGIHMSTFVSGSRGFGQMDGRRWFWMEMTFSTICDFL